MNADSEQLETAQNQQISNVLTSEKADELISLFASSQVQVKYGAISAILQYCQLNPSNQQHFKQKHFFDEIKKSMHMAQMTKLCLATLINFSSTLEQDDFFARELTRIIDTVILSLRDGSFSGLHEELGFLLLLNVSKSQQFIYRVLGKQQQPQVQPQTTVNHIEPMLLQFIYNFLEQKSQERVWVIANVFVNLSSHELGRQYVAEQKLYLGFIKYLNDGKEAVRLAVLRLLRNIAFLWETEEVIVEILKKENELLDQLGIHILAMLIKSELAYPPQAAKQLLVEYLDGDRHGKLLTQTIPQMSTKEINSINQIAICIDIVLILSNANFQDRNPQFKKQHFLKVLSLLKFVNKLEEATMDKIEALETFCFV